MKLTPNALRNMIIEETKNITEAVDLAAEAKIYNTANKLLIAIQAFEKDANPNMVSAITIELTKLQKHLSNMKISPGKYNVAVEPKSVQKVSLKPVPKKDKIILFPIRNIF